MNFITAQLIPQRSQLLGLVVAGLIYLLLWRKQLISAGILAGLLPIIHAHSYLVTLMIGAWFGWKFLLPALFLGLAQIAYIYGFDSGKDFLAWDPSWLKEWWRLEPMLPLLIWGLISAPPKLKKFSLPFWLMFVLANLFRFQPYDWDNTKLFIHWYLIASIATALVLVRWKLFGLFILPLLIFPGVREVAKIAKNSHQYQFFNLTQLAVAEKVRSVTPPPAVFLTASNHNHWLPALTGRKIVMGYPGWLWTYGINYREREREVKEIYETGDKNLLKKYPVDYLVIGPDEKTLWPKLNEAYFTANFPLVFDELGYKIFKLK